MAKRQEQYKPLLFTTTMRNPDRIKYFLNVLLHYNGQVLTDKLATQIMGDCIKIGIYRPMKKTNEIKAKWSTISSPEPAELVLSDKEVNWILANNLNIKNGKIIKPKMAGFDYGWPSRFDTYYDLMKHLGFVYYSIGEKIVFSELGQLYANSISIEVDEGIIEVTDNHPEFREQAFLQSMAKYQRNNPFKRVLNNNSPLILLLQVIKKLNNDKDFNSVGISRSEIPLLLYWKDNDADGLYQRIKLLRKEYRYNPSWETIISICQNEIMEGNDIKREPKTIMEELPDEFIRKMRLTGIISYRGGGRFLDINKTELEKVNYILDKYSNPLNFSDERKYFNYMSETDTTLLSFETKEVDQNIKETLLMDWVNHYSFETLKEELKILSEKKLSKDLILKEMGRPERLEFLTAIAIKSAFRNVRVIPNYNPGDDGIPRSTAGGAGDQGDIECFEEENGILVEVTMSNGTQQHQMESASIARHLKKFSTKIDGNSICYLVAPKIFNDTKEFMEFGYFKDKRRIKGIDIVDFTKFLEKNEKLYNWKEPTV